MQVATRKGTVSVAHMIGEVQHDTHLKTNSLVARPSARSAWLARALESSLANLSDTSSATLHLARQS